MIVPILRAVALVVEAVPPLVRALDRAGDAWAARRRERRAMREERPMCSGEYLSGSGGHRVHAPCGRPADWWHPDDLWAYCDAHVGRDREMYRRWGEDPWLDEPWTEAELERIRHPGELRPLPDCPACGDRPAVSCPVCGAVNNNGGGR